MKFKKLNPSSQKGNNGTLKILLLLILLANMSWLQNGFKSSRPTESNTENKIEITSVSYSSSDTAGSIKQSGPNYIVYQVGNPDYNYTVQLQRKEVPATDNWGVPLPPNGTSQKKEKVIFVTAEMDDCDQINCHKSLVIKESDLVGLNNPPPQEIANQINQKIAPIMKQLAQENKKQKEQEQKEAKKEAKRQKLIDQCQIDEETDKPFPKRSDYLECRIDKLSLEDDSKARAQFSEIADELHDLLTSKNSRQHKTGEQLLKKLNQDQGALPFEINAQVEAMSAGDYYNRNYPKALQDTLTATNPWKRQMALGKLNQLEQAYQYQKTQISQSSEQGSEEMEFWQDALQKNIDLILNDPRSSLTGNSNTSTAYELTSKDVSGRLSRSGSRTATFSPLTSRSAADILTTRTTQR